MTPFGKSKHLFILTSALVVCITLVSCTSPGMDDNDLVSDASGSYLSEPTELSPAMLAEGEKLHVVTTTSIVADVVSNVGGDALELTTLMPANVDPHSYEPTPSDLRAVSNANVVFINGLGLEEFIEEMLRNVGGDVPVVSLSKGVNAIVVAEESNHDDGVTDEKHLDGGLDPHVWFDPSNLLIWVDRIVLSLSHLEPDLGTVFKANGQKFKEELLDLDGWIVEKVSKVPEGNRLLVTDHKVFEYFAARYGFDVVGAVIPVFSSAAEPSAREIAVLQDRIKELEISVIFVGEFINPAIVETIVADTETKMVTLYTGSLSDEDGPAGNYLDFMRYNVESIVNALLGRE